MVGKVAWILTDAGELPKEVSPFFLEPLFNAPERGESCALMGYMCPAHEDNVSLGGETENRTIALHRLIESAVVERGHYKSLCVNVNCCQCLKARDEHVTRFSEFVRALYFAALDAYDVKVTRIVQCCGSEDLAKGPFHLGPWLERFPAAGHLLSLPATPFFSSPHPTATKVNKS